MFNAKTPCLDRQLQIDTFKHISDTITDHQILEVINPSTKLQKFTFCSIRHVPNGTITLETSLTSSTETGVASSQVISGAFDILDITTTNMYANSWISQFVIHSVPSKQGINSTAEEMQQIVQEVRTFTSVGLTVPPRCLARPGNIKHQSNRSIIVSFPEKVKHLGLKCTMLFNCGCRLEKAKPDNRLVRC